VGSYPSINITVSEEFGVKRLACYNFFVNQKAFSSFFAMVEDPILPNSMIGENRVF